MTGARELLDWLDRPTPQSDAAYLLCWFGVLGVLYAVTRSTR
jgi:hypothetical protein